MAAGAIALLSLSLIAGHVKYGAANWISLFGFSFQPSELAKPCYIFAGAATLERLFRKRNLGLFILLTGVCMGCLALMSDFGTAAIFFVTFLVIAYLRSGDFATLSLICGGAVFGGLMLVTVKPYILRRFAAWGHAWEQASDGGFQQTRTMSAAAYRGVLPRVAPGGEALKDVGLEGEHGEHRKHPAAADEGQGGPVAGAEVGDNQEGDKEDGGGAEVAHIG